MKRTIAAGLSAALLCGMVVPAFAADTKTATNTTGTTQTQPTAPVKLTFDKLEETVRQNNVTIKANNNTVLSAEKTDVSDQYIESYFQLSEQISSYQKQIKELQKTLNSLDASKEENAGLRKTLESQISILQRNLAAAEASYRNLDDDEDDAEEDQEKTVDNTRRQMQNAADEICLSAENTYISLRGMKYTLNQTNRSIQQHCDCAEAGKAGYDRCKHAQEPAGTARERRCQQGLADHAGRGADQHARYPVRLYHRYTDRNERSSGRNRRAGHLH